jgi:small subunit ribosomal protein S16
MVKLRLARAGSKRHPIYRIVAADSRCPRDGRFIEKVGHYNPNVEPPTLLIESERLDYWLSKGAQPSETVRNLIRKHKREAAAVQ